MNLPDIHAQGRVETFSARTARGGFRIATYANLFAESVDENKAGRDFENDPQ